LYHRVSYIHHVLYRFILWTRLQCVILRNGR
jgi:hypothetical protein